MRCAGRGACAALLLSLVAGCASPGSVVVAPDHVPARQMPPRLDADGILLLYSHGSREEFLRDRCFPGSVTTPRWLRAFADERIADLPVSIYAFCTPTRVGDYRHEARTGRPKVEQRAEELEQAVREFVHQGFAPRRIFLLGHSAGGWASLWAVRDGEPRVAGVIAFAPAFAGPRRGRPAGWQWLRARHVDALQRSTPLAALVFTYRGDPFEDAATLSFLRTIPGTELVVLDSADCPDRRPHRAAFSSCVMDAGVRARMRAFIERRLAGARPVQPRYHGGGPRRHAARVGPGNR